MSKIRRRDRKVMQMNLEIRGSRRPLGIEFDETGTAMYVRMREGTAVVTRSVGDEVQADYDENGDLIGVEFLGITAEREVQVPEELRKKHPGEVPEMRLVLA